jgi:hypothetical protein
MPLKQRHKLREVLTAHRIAGCIQIENAAIMGFRSLLAWKEAIADL